jgi:hypothetical protein
MDAEHASHIADRIADQLDHILDSPGRRPEGARQERRDQLAAALADALPEYRQGFSVGQLRVNDAMARAAVQISTPTPDGVMELAVVEVQARAFEHPAYPVEAKTFTPDEAARYNDETYPDGFEPLVLD